MKHVDVELEDGVARNFTRVPGLRCICAVTDLLKAGGDHYVERVVAAPGASLFAVYTREPVEPFIRMKDVETP